MAITVVWTSQTALSPSRYNFGAVGVSGKVYAISGLTTNASYTTSVQEYDPITNAWTAKTAIPFAREDFAYAAGDNGLIYIFGGWVSAGTPSANTYVFDPVGNSWVLGTPSLTARIGAAAVNIPGTSSIYIIGGGTGRACVLSNINQEFDTSVAFGAGVSYYHCVMPTARYGLGAVYLNGSIYAIGGHAGVTICKTVEAYNVGTGAWTTLADMPAARSKFFCFIFGGKIYVAGGLDPTHPLVTSVYEYDPVANTWAILTTTMPDASGLVYGAVAEASGLIYLIGGVTSSFALVGTNEQFTDNAFLTSTAYIYHAGLSADAYVVAEFTQVINSDASLIKRSTYAQVVSPGFFGGRAAGVTVFGSPVATIQSDAMIGLYSNSNQTSVVDVFISSTDPLLVLDLASVQPPFGYQNYDWSYDWVVRTRNQAVCKFEVRSADSLVALNSQPFTLAIQGQIIPRADIHRYHQYKMHLWASGSNDFEFHQFTIKAYVDHPAYPYARTLTPQIKTSTSSITLGVPVDQPDIVL